jgi:8-oxo-dGTP diphosphatase
MAGGWEFPGGKRAEGEPPLDGLVRELKEELGVDVLTAVPVIAYTHSYSDRTVLLDLWHVTEYRGTPSSAEGQAIKWVRVDDLDKIGLLEADTPMIRPLRPRH